MYLGRVLKYFISNPILMGTVQRQTGGFRAVGVGEIPYCVENRWNWNNEIEQLFSTK